MWSKFVTEIFFSLCYKVFLILVFFRSQLYAYSKLGFDIVVIIAIQNTILLYNIVVTILRNHTLC